MLNGRTQNGPAAYRLWPVLLLFLAAVLVPAGCVVWFMALAINNETLAVRQRLRDVYAEKVAGARGLLDADFGRRLARLAEGQGLSPGQRFALLAAESEADGIVVCDKQGRRVYPGEAIPNAEDPKVDDSAWRAAGQLEQDAGSMTSAAEAYAGLARQESDPAGKARALQAQSRCLVRLGQRAEALGVLRMLLADEKLRDVADVSGRLIGPNAQLLELQLLANRDQPEYEERVLRLRGRLADYRGTPMPASQRCFLLRSLEEMSPSGQVPPILAAEELTAEYLETEQMPAEPGALTATRTVGLWQVATPDRTVVALYRLDRLQPPWQELIRAGESAHTQMRLQPPRANPTQPEPFMSSPAGEHLPGWTLQVLLVGRDLYSLAANRKALYLWTGGAGITFIAALAVAVAGFVGRQMRLTRLKNDLIATVSHELKTPLASMRMLVDTLLEGRYRDDKQVHEYLQLIARENVRLSRLIDNFLTFSRMERNKKSFDFREVQVQDIVSGAVEAVQDRFAAPGCRLEVHVESGLPAVVGDRDGLTTVLLNLLDNAYKYTGDDKHVRVRGCAEDGQVVLEVADNGIGIPRRAMRRIFERFYQVDQSLSRKAGGCGLGLSIVQFIVTAHGGVVSVTSEPGKGSKFAVRLPGRSGNG